MLNTHLEKERWLLLARCRLTMLLVQAEQGMFLTLVPQDFDGKQIDAGFQELGIKPLQVCELAGWQIAKKWSVRGGRALA